MTRKPGLINGPTIVGLLVGPALGALLYALVGGLVTMSGEFFGFFLAWTIAPGYLIGLPLFAIALLAMRHFRADALWLCALLGAAVGLFNHYAVLGASTASGERLSSLLFAGLPFAVMFVTSRLIAGPRT
jgi:hypothetical protein